MAKIFEPEEDGLNEKQREQLEWLESHGVPNKDKNAAPRPLPGQKKKPELKKSKFYIEMEVEEEIDLHGCTIDEALALADDFLTMCKKKGARSARIVHGHGRKSPESIEWQLKRKLKTQWKHRFQSLKNEPHNFGALIVLF